MSSRDAILQKLHSARQPFDNMPAIEERQPVVPMGNATADQLKAIFIEQGKLLSNVMWQVDDDEAALEKLLEIIGNEKRVLHWDAEYIPVQGLSEALNQNGIERADHRDASVHIGITGVDCAVASTASLIVESGEGKSRMVSLLPYVHVAIVRVEQIVPNLESWYTQQANRGLSAFKDASMTNIISGPSRTADIGMELVVGAHGPAELHCIVIG